MAEEAPRLVKEKRQKIILGVDRLDYTKGLVHRLKAFERFLEKHPEHIEEVDYMTHFLFAHFLEITNFFTFLAGYFHPDSRTITYGCQRVSGA